MIIKRAKVLGFCMGVRRAVELAVNESLCAAETGSRVYTLGPLIHNQKVLNDLKEKGIEVIEEPPSKCKNCFCSEASSTIIIRAHGISPEKEKALRETGCKIVDATCPKVKASQLKAKELALAGYSIFLAGEAAHAEIEGVFGYASIGEVQQNNGQFSAGSFAAKCSIVKNKYEAQEAALRLTQVDKNAKTALLGQTTISETLYKEIADVLKKYFSNLEVINTTCTATSERQRALHDLLHETDAVIIAGGKYSANTLHLFEIAKDSRKPCVLAEDANDIPLDFFSYETVGICAGASTPDCVIDEIEARLNR